MQVIFYKTFYKSLFRCLLNIFDEATEEAYG